VGTILGPADWRFLALASALTIVSVFFLSARWSFCLSGFC
jgi:hypothetical protein